MTNNMTNYYTAKAKAKAIIQKMIEEGTYTQNQISIAVEDSTALSDLYVKRYIQKRIAEGLIKEEEENGVISKC